MIKWNKYIKWGDFTSTNGIELKYKWEFDRLNNYKKDENIILASILCLAHPYKIVGISTINPKSLEKHCKAIYYPKTDISDGFVDYKYVLYDDVITTGKNMITATKKYGKIPEKYICIVDRRDEGKKDVNYKNIDYKGINLDVISIINKLKINMKQVY